MFKEQTRLFLQNSKISCTPRKLVAIYFVYDPLLEFCQGKMVKLNTRQPISLLFFTTSTSAPLPVQLHNQNNVTHSAPVPIHVMIWYLLCSRDNKNYQLHWNCEIHVLLQNTEVYWDVTPCGQANSYCHYKGL